MEEAEHTGSPGPCEAPALMGEFCHVIKLMSVSNNNDNENRAYADGKGTKSLGEQGGRQGMERG